MCSESRVFFLYLLLLFLVFVDGKKGLPPTDDNLKYQLPSFLIAGTQKSGTTALSALLAGHESIVFAKQKEVHFFDQTASYDKGIDEYMKNFPHHIHYKNNTIYGEATPSYVSSRIACKRIMKDLPNEKMIVLLRSPVDRAYSAYQMRQRKVNELSEFFTLIVKNHTLLVDCLLSADHIKPNSIKWSYVTEHCAPMELSNHPLWRKLKSAIIKCQATIPDRNWAATINTCFPIKGRGLDFTVCGGQDVWETKKFYSLEKYFITDVEEFRSCGGDALRDIEIEYKHSGHGGGYNGNANKTSDKEFLVHMEIVSNSIDRCLGGEKNDTKNVTKNDSIKTPHYYRSLFAPQLYHCFQSIPSAQFLIIPNGKLKREPDSVMRSVLQFLGLPQQQPIHTNKTDTFAASHNATVHTRNNSNSSVFHVSGNRNVTSASRIDVSDAGIATAIGKHFPGFDKSVSWQLHGEYEPMPSAIRASLETFFRPYNHMLERLLSLHNATVLGDVLADW